LWYENSSIWNSFWLIETVLINNDDITVQRDVMKMFRSRIILILAFTIGTIVGIFRGNEAKQKWVFRIKSRFDEKRQLAEQKRLMRDGGVALDDIEIAAFHNN
jgi:hypothetical protein